MRNASGSGSTLYTLQSSSTSVSGSPWIYDAGVDMDLDEDLDGGDGDLVEDGHIIWQASQSPCDALNRLLVDAHTSMTSEVIQILSPCILFSSFHFLKKILSGVGTCCQRLAPHELSSPTNTWSPSPSSISDSAFAMTPQSRITEMPLRRKIRPTKPPSRIRQSHNSVNHSNPNTNPGSPSTDSQHPPSNNLFPLAHSAARLENATLEVLSSIRSVGRQVDADAAKMRMTVERARMKAEAERKQVRMRKSATKSRSRVGGLGRSLSGPAEVGETSAKVVEDSGRLKDMDVDVDEDTRRMPPPANIPIRRSSSANGPALDDGGKSGPRSVPKVEVPKEKQCKALSASPSSPLNIKEQSDTPADLTTNQITMKVEGTEPAGLDEPNVEPSTTASIVPKSTCRKDAISEAPSSKLNEGARKRRHPVLSDSTMKYFSKSERAAKHLRTNDSVIPSPSPPQSVEVDTKSTHFDFPSPSPRSQGPPVLGMRRPTNSQSPSTGSTLNLPTKQKKFKSPLAKNAGMASSTTNGRTSSTGTADKANSPVSRTSKPEERAAIVARARAKQVAKAEEGLEQCRTQAKVASDGKIGSAKDVHTAQRSSSPPAEVNDSFTSADFDMGIDEDELEKVCSMYD
jgi:hypothetical protein